MLAAFTLTAFLAALLLFQVQPMVGKLLLPLLGGSPSVWNTCMLFFQAALLAGYAWAHLLARIERKGVQIALHAALLGAAALLLILGAPATAEPPAEGSPVLWLLVTLAKSVGLPFVAVAATAPLIQKWFSSMDDRRAADPYFLYAASNAGSLLGLLGYPLLVEPALDLDRQRALWSGGYVLLALLIVSCAVMALRRPGQRTAQRAPAAPAPGPARYVWWATLALVPSSLMLAVTQHITTDVATVPLFWVVPLAIYLVTFILAFSPRVVVRPGPWSRLLMATAIGGLAIAPTWNRIPVSVNLGLNMLLLFLGCMVCHGRLAAARPGTAALTGYYLAIAAGGAGGGILNALVAPAIFNGVYEYPLAIAAAFLLRDRAALGLMRTRTVRWLNLGLDTLVVILAGVAIPWMMSMPGVNVLSADRTFFGVHRVTGDDEWHRFYHGHILHNVQLLADPHRPLAYYSDQSGIGQLYLRLPGDPRLNDVAIVGLGAGTMGAWQRPGQRYTFFEIDPAIVRMARDPALFTYLADMPESPRIVLGDGRLSLQREPDGRFGLIVLDAFSSDAIPVHMLTTEAIDLYFRKLQPQGLLAVHVSNRYLDLVPLVRGLADDRGLFVAHWGGPAKVDENSGIEPSIWLILARDRAAVSELVSDPAWQLLAPQPGDPVWTDRSSNLLALVKWWR